MVFITDLNLCHHHRGKTAANYISHVLPRAFPGQQLWERHPGQNAPAVGARRSAGAAPVTGMSLCGWKFQAFSVSFGFDPFTYSRWGHEFCPSPRGHWAMSGDICGSPDWGRSWYAVGGGGDGGQGCQLLSTLQHPGQRTRTDPAQVPPVPRRRHGLLGDDSTGQSTAGRKVGNGAGVAPCRERR